MYLVFYVRFICKGCVREKECEDSRQWKTKAVFVSSSRVGFLQSEAYALYMIGMRRVRIEWRQLVFASVSQVRPSHETLAKTSYHHPILTLRIPVMCRAHASLHRKPTHELPTKTVSVFNCLKSSHSLSITHYPYK